MPIAFVSEHVETLVELDHEVRDHALEHGVKDYVRAPALGTDPLYIQSLVNLVTEAHGQSHSFCGGGHDPFFNIEP